MANNSPAIAHLLEKQSALLRPARVSLPEADAMIKGIGLLLKKAGLDAVCVAGGSYAKGTILKDDFDVDLFVRFAYSYRGKDISELLARAIKSLRPERVHGSRDYFQLRRKKILFEIIPVLKIDDYRKADNVTDMSPLHVGYANSRFARNPKMRDDVRLAKQFCKAAGVYGAESYIRGFSGHVLDLLIIYYGGFEKLLMQAALWGERVVIDIERHWSDPVGQLNSSKVISPLVIVDPIQPDRNAAAAISPDKFEDFKSQARRFLHSPSGEFFKVKRLDMKELRKVAGKNELMVVQASPVEGKDDVVGTKLLKAFEFLQRMLGENDFTVMLSGWEYKPKPVFYFVIRKEKLSATKTLRGPPQSDAANSAAFRKKHRKVSVNSGVLFAEEKRKFLSARKLLAFLLKDKYLSGKAKSFRLGK